MIRCGVLEEITIEVVSLSVCLAFRMRSGCVSMDVVHCDRLWNSRQRSMSSIRRRVVVNIWLSKV